MTQTTRVTILMLIMMGLSGCVIFNSSPKLVDTSWRALEIGGADVIDEKHSTLSFSDEGRIGGSGGCNRMFGQYETSGDKLKIHSIGATKMACIGPIMDQEMRYFSALESVASYQVKDSELVLLDSGGKTVARFVREPQA